MFQFFFLVAESQQSRYGFDWCLLKPFFFLLYKCLSFPFSSLRLSLAYFLIFYYDYNCCYIGLGLLHMNLVFKSVNFTRFLICCTDKFPWWRPKATLSCEYKVKCSNFWKLQQIKMQIHRAQTKGTHLQNTGTPKAQETLRKTGPEYQGVSSETVSPPNIGSDTHKVSPGWLPTCELSKDDVNTHAKVDEEKHRRPQPFTKDYRQLRNIESGRNRLPKEEHGSWLSTTKWSALKTRYM